METHLANLASLHEFEESLRPQNLVLIEKSDVLGEHYKVVGEAMNVLQAFTKIHVNKSDDELTIQTRVAGLRGPIVRFSYKVVRAEDGLLLCEGETVHVVVGRDMKRRPIPRRYAELLAPDASYVQD